MIDDAVTVVDHLESRSATFNGPAEAFVRLVSGWLKAPYDNGVTIEGIIALDDLRRVFLVSDGISGPSGVPDNVIYRHRLEVIVAHSQGGVVAYEALGTPDVTSTSS